MKPLKEFSVKAAFFCIVVSCSAEALKPAKGPAEARYADKPGGTVLPLSCSRSSICPGDQEAH